MTRIMTERKKNQMRRMKTRVEMKKTAIMLVKVRSESCFGIGSLVLFLQYDF